ncbi:hypothetical protein BKA70DRAFT_1440704 [Coprinopsis sp. MPI-PUGE-AT-0042]|nr:hypothetical protein BKA70DRAFT_1440704 [Coprinopsis sp. MPI-PUGE-AT-0042]
MTVPKRRDKKNYSKAQLRAAHAEDMRKSYNNQKAEIAQRRKVQREAKKDREEHRRKKKRCSTDTTSTLVACATANEPRYNWHLRRLEKIPQEIKVIFQGVSKYAFIDQVARNAVGIAIRDAKAAEAELDRVLEPFQGLLADLRGCQEKVLEQFGAKEEWQKGQEIEKDLRQVILDLEDLVIHLIEGTLRYSY